MATNLVLPALPEVRSHFGASMAGVQSILSVYMIAFACSLLIVGPMSDRWGRRPVLIGGLIVFAFGSLISAGAPSLAVLVFGRVIQAMGASVGIVISRAVAGDRYEGVELSRKIALLTVVAVGSTTASPFFGGLLSEATGWRGNFFVLAIVPLLLAAICGRVLPETRSSEHLGMPLAALLRSSRAVIAQPAFLISVLQSSLIFSIFMVFVTGTPHLMEHTFSRSPSDFGLYYMFISCGYFLGNLQVSRGHRGPDLERSTQIGLWMQLSFAVLGLIFVLAGLIHPIWLFGPMLPLSFGQGLAMPHVTAKAVSLAPGYAGVAASLLGFSQQALSAISVQGMGWAPSDTAIPVMIYCVVAAFIALLPVLLIRPIARDVPEM
jgi:DHA1 family bicyclomycin/chloramphenicol resistance-like MFS transporter